MEKGMKKYAVLIQPWGVGVKEWWYYVEQGGLRQKWGKHWRGIFATSIEDARIRGFRIRDGKNAKPPARFNFSLRCVE